jgi:hypothetical protein
VEKNEQAIHVAQRAAQVDRLFLIVLRIVAQAHEIGQERTGAPDQLNQFVAEFSPIRPAQFGNFLMPQRELNQGTEIDRFD